MGSRLYFCFLTVCLSVCRDLGVSTNNLKLLTNFDLNRKSTTAVIVSPMRVKNYFVRPPKQIFTLKMFVLLLTSPADWWCFLQKSKTCTHRWRHENKHVWDEFCADRKLQSLEHRLPRSSALHQFVTWGFGLHNSSTNIASESRSHIFGCGICDSRDSIKGTILQKYI